MVFVLDFHLWAIVQDIILLGFLINLWGLNVFWGIFSWISWLQCNIMVYQFIDKENIEKKLTFAKPVTKKRKVIGKIITPF